MGYIQLAVGGRNEDISGKPKDANGQTLDDTIYLPAVRKLPRQMPAAIGIAEENGHYTRDAKAWA